MIGKSRMNGSWPCENQLMLWSRRLHCRPWSPLLRAQRAADCNSSPGKWLRVIEGCVNATDKSSDSSFGGNLLDFGYQRYKDIFTLAVHAHFPFTQIPLSCLRILRPRIDLLHRVLYLLLRQLSTICGNLRHHNPECLWGSACWLARNGQFINVDSIILF